MLSYININDKIDKKFTLNGALAILLDSLKRELCGFLLSNEL